MQGSCPARHSSKSQVRQHVDSRRHPPISSASVAPTSVGTFVNTFWLFWVPSCKHVNSWVQSCQCAPDKAMCGP